MQTVTQTVQTVLSHKINPFQTFDFFEVLIGDHIVTRHPDRSIEIKSRSGIVLLAVENYIQLHAALHQ